MRSILIFNFLFLTFATQAIGHIVIEAPQGWYLNRNYMGMDYALFTPYKPNRLQPILFVHTDKGVYTDKSSLNFLLSETKKNPEAIVLSSGLVSIQNSKAAFIKMSRQKGNETVLEYMVMVPHGKEYHMLVFSAPEDYFEDYSADVKMIVQKARLTEK